MSSNNNKNNPSKTPTTDIKLAPKEASKRNSTGADPGPGDPNAAPSVAPQLIDLPAAPTPSQLIVKSTASHRSNRPTSAAITTYNEQNPASIPKSTHSMGGGGSKSKVDGSQAGPAASNPSVGAAQEPTSSRPLTGPSNGGKSTALSEGGSVGGASQKSGVSGASPQRSTTGSTATQTGQSRVSAAPGAVPSSSNKGAPNTASQAMQADSGAVHDEDEEGEGEVEQPETPGSVAPATSPMGGSKSTTQADGTSAVPPASSGEASGKTGKQVPSELVSSSSKKDGHSKSTFMPSDHKSSVIPVSGKGKGKKVTKFRYHKRITVRTSGKTSPSTIMEKVNKKDHRVGITPSAIEEMDPQELMRKAGIKGNDKTHWRVRLRQTKRLTKDGKTVTQTKVAYRDSEGNKRIKTSSEPFCKACGKKLEECKCESNTGT